MTAIHFVNLLSIICNVFLFGLCCICTALTYGKAKGYKPADFEMEQETSKSIDNSCEDSSLSEPSATTTEEEWETYKGYFLKPRAARYKLILMVEADTLIMLRSVLRRAKTETTLEDYIGNILIDHLGIHLELIKKIEDKQKP